MPQQQRGCVLPPLFMARLSDTQQQAATRTTRRLQPLVYPAHNPVYSEPDPRQSRLQPYVFKAATVRNPGCNPTRTFFCRCLPMPCGS